MCKSYLRITLTSVGLNARSEMQGVCQFGVDEIRIMTMWLVSRDIRALCVASGTSHAVDRPHFFREFLQSPM